MEDGTLVQQHQIHEVHYIQEPILESVTLDGTQTVIHYIQLQDPSVPVEMKIK